MQWFFFLICLFFINFANAETKTVGIMLYLVKDSKPWDPESINTGITGSEEAVIYMSQHLTKLGYKVIVFGNPPKGSIHSLPEANPRYVNCSYYYTPMLDIAISWRMPARAEELKRRAKKVYLWPHDTYHWPLTDEQINGFDDVLWVSKWQREQWISVNPQFKKFANIFGNGVNPEQFRPIQERANPYSCIYGSNYARGLEILLDIWPDIRKEFPRATLDIYYGWQHWGLLSEEKEAKMRAQIKGLESSGVHEHGLVSHRELNKAYEQASFWTYPCIATETFCISALRAQLAGAIPVIIQGSALYETVPSGYSCTSVEDYSATLLKAMKSAEKISLDDRKKMGDLISKEFPWEKVASKWKELFESSAISNFHSGDKSVDNAGDRFDVVNMCNAFSRLPVVF